MKRYIQFFERMKSIFLLTANVGSVFENLDCGFPIWMKELTGKIKIDNPDFVALHFQETGGKDYKNGSKVIQNFFSALVENFTISGYNLIEGIIDSDADVPSQFTALSNVYFIRNNSKTVVQIWDFAKSNFVSINPSTCGKLFMGKEIILSTQNQKEKFPQHFFPNCKWSRKGFARTRWRVGGITFDLVNIHLFHDSSNLIAASTFPSPFSQNRQRALNFILDKFDKDDLAKVPMFIFGDFNFRVNTFDIFEILRKEAVATELGRSSVLKTEEGSESPPPPSSNSTVDLVIDAKRFSVSNQEQRFKEDWNWLRPYDFESTQFDTLTELDVNFHPTYPFDESDPGKFMKTRCPSWCDRILFTHDSKNIMDESTGEYNLIGSDVCMGDHKPVYLKFLLKSENEKSNLESPIEIISESSITESGIPIDNPCSDVGQKSRCRFVTFLRENLSFHHETTTRSRGMKSLSLAPSVTSTTTSTSPQGTNCCFIKIRNFDAGESQGLTKGGKKGRGRRNILLSNEIEANPLGYDGDKTQCPNGKSIISEIQKSEVRNRKGKKVKESSNTSNEMERANGSGDLTSSGCCPECIIL